MKREEPAEIASPMWEGSKLYQKRARLALPLLVRQAKARQPITYGSLAKELRMPNARNLNYPLGSIRASLQLLGEKWGKDSPPAIQVLVENETTKLPGKGIALSPEIGISFQSQVKAEQVRVYAYQRWDDVLRDLNLEPAPSNAVLIKIAKSSRGGGGVESEEHRQLKEYVRDHPKSLGLRHKSKDAKLERGLPSGDSLDVSFESPERWTAVEVKSAKSNKADQARGVFQCVKYEAVMEAELASKASWKRNFEVKAILVVEEKLDPDLWRLANTLGVRVCEVQRGK